MKEFQDCTPTREVSSPEDRRYADLPFLPKGANPEDFKPRNIEETYDKVLEKFNLVESQKSTTTIEKAETERIPNTLEKGDDGKYYDKETGKCFESLEAWRKHVESLVKRYNTCADRLKTKADKEYARFKNSEANGESESQKWDHYHKSQRCYAKEKECREKAQKLQELLDNY